jgi:hypothetical protein
MERHHHVALCKSDILMHFCRLFLCCYRAIAMYIYTVFSAVTLCGSYKNRRFGGMCRLCHQGDKNLRGRKNVSSN